VENMIISKMFGDQKYFFKSLGDGKLEFVCNIDLAYKYAESEKDFEAANEVKKLIDGELEDRNPMYLINELQDKRNLIVNFDELFGITEFLLMHDTDYSVDQVDSEKNRCRISLEILTSTTSF
jgi:hypothetical protein